VKAAPGVIVKLMGCYLALAVLGLMVLLVLLENISSSKKNDADGPEGGAAVDGTKMSFQVPKYTSFFSLDYWSTDLAVSCSSTERLQHLVRSFRTRARTHILAQYPVLTGVINRSIGESRSLKALSGQKKVS
jgi:hypothetical protein